MTSTAATLAEAMEQQAELSVYVLETIAEAAEAVAEATESAGSAIAAAGSAAREARDSVRTALFARDAARDAARAVRDATRDAEEGGKTNVTAPLAPDTGAPEHPAGILALLVDSGAPLRCQQRGRMTGKGLARERCFAAATQVQVDVGRNSPGAANRATAAYCEAHAPAQDGGEDGSCWLLPVGEAAAVMRAAAAADTISLYLPRDDDDDEGRQRVVLLEARRILADYSRLDDYRVQAWEAFIAAGKR